MLYFVYISVCCSSLSTNKVIPTYDVFHPQASAEDRDKRFKKWKMAVDRASHSYECPS